MTYLLILPGALIAVGVLCGGVLWRRERARSPHAEGALLEHERTTTVGGEQVRYQSLSGYLPPKDPLSAPPHPGP